MALQNGGRVMTRTKSNPWNRPAEPSPSLPRSRARSRRSLYLGRFLTGFAPAARRAKALLAIRMRIAASLEISGVDWASILYGSGRDGSFYPLRWTLSARIALSVGLPAVLKRVREAPVGIEPTNSRFAVCRLTTWPRRRAPKLTGPFHLQVVLRAVCSASIIRPPVVTGPLETAR